MKTISFNKILLPFEQCYVKYKQTLGGQMLEFIVLGQIPGTHIEITFRGVLFFITIAVTIIEINSGWRHNRQSSQSTTDISQTSS